MPRPGDALPRGSSESRGSPFVRHSALRAAKASPRPRQTTLRGRAVRPRRSSGRPGRELAEPRSVRWLFGARGWRDASWRGVRGARSWARASPVALRSDTARREVGVDELQDLEAGFLARRGALRGSEAVSGSRSTGSGASTYSPPSPTRPSGRGGVDGVCDMVPGLGHRLAECRGGLRTDEAVQRFAEGFREGPMAFTESVLHPSG